jgi:hypothetical protein
VEIDETALGGLGHQTRAGSGPDADESRSFADKNRRWLAGAAGRVGSRSRIAARGRRR